MTKIEVPLAFTPPCKVIGSNNRLPFHGRVATTIAQQLCACAPAIVQSMRTLVLLRKQHWGSGWFIWDPAMFMGAGARGCVGTIRFSSWLMRSPECMLLIIRYARAISRYYNTAWLTTVGFGHGTPRARDVTVIRIFRISLGEGIEWNGRVMWKLNNLSATLLVDLRYIRCNLLGREVINSL